jgi:hypothetical protein
MKEQLEHLLAKESILITKETKKGIREIDLKPGIYELTWDGSAFHMLIDASSAGNIKPIQIIEALLADCGETLKENALLITREDVFTGLETAGERRLVSLGEIGTDC